MCRVNSITSNHWLGFGWSIAAVATLFYRIEDSGQCCVNGEWRIESSFDFDYSSSYAYYLHRHRRSTKWLDQRIVAEYDAVHTTLVGFVCITRLPTNTKLILCTNQCGQSQRDEADTEEMRWRRIWKIRLDDQWEWYHNAFYSRNNTAIILVFVVQNGVRDGYDHGSGLQVSCCMLEFSIIWLDQQQQKCGIVFRVLERIGTRALSAHLRKLCDYLTYDFSNSGVNANINRRVDAINDLIWKYNVVTLDRLVLCLALRSPEGNEAQVCFCIIQLLLLKSPEFRSRVHEFVKENSPDHWKQNNWYISFVLWVCISGTKTRSNWKIILGIESFF